MKLVTSFVALLAVACGSSAKPTPPAPISSTASAEARTSESVEIWTTVVDNATDQPIQDALVVVLRSAVDVEHVDLKHPDKHALSRGRSDAAGIVRLGQRIPVPGTYSVVVIAAGYEPLLGQNTLRLSGFSLPEDTASPFDPWGKISLRTENGPRKIQP